MVSADVSELILAEVRELQRSVNENIRVTGERLSALETSMRALIGNGNPGRITLLERAVTRLQEWRWKMLGIYMGASAVVSVIAWLVVLVLHK